MRLLLPALLCCAFLTWPAAPAGPTSLTAPPPAPAFGAPLVPPEVARPFARPASAYGPGHRGVDLAAAPGTPVLAAGAGLVLYAGRMVDRDVVSIEHPGGLRTTYEPVAPLVAVGDQVSRGQPIGRLEPGHPGCPAAPQRACLHWGARRGAEYLDPVRLFSGGRVRLLPW